MPNQSQKCSSLATPNYILWEYFTCLSEQVKSINELTDKKDIQRKALLCVFLSITIVETFLNIYFRQLAEESGFKSHRDQTLKELVEIVPLDLKIKVWPRRFLGNGLDFSYGIGQRFMTLKKLRNNLMHFKSSYESIEIPGIRIQGVTNIAPYETLDKNVAMESLCVAKEMIQEIFRLKGINAEDIQGALHNWIGEVPVTEGK